MHALVFAVLLSAASPARERAPATAHPPAPLPECPAETFLPLLERLDAGQRPGQGESLRDVFTADARIEVRWGERRDDRGLDQFIREVEADAAPPLAYAFEAPTVSCTRADRATLTRRGCRVERQPGQPLVEESQTERLQVVRSHGTWRILRLLTIGDAVRVGGREQRADQPWFLLPACEQAAREASGRR